MDNRTGPRRSTAAAHNGALHRAAVLVIRYYAALKISATAATTLLPVDLRFDIPPIVRPADNRLVNGFDRRELVHVNGREHVIVLDDSRPNHHIGTGFFSN